VTSAWEALATGRCDHEGDDGESAWKREDASDGDWVTWRCQVCGQRAVTLAGG